MSAELPEELISAYLDDEVSPEERTRVEKWLAESAEHRQLYDELRAMRVDLASLPRHKLSEDLGPAVLRRAERTVLSPREQPPPGMDGMPSSGFRQWARGRSPRMIVWPAIAIAAALLIAVFATNRDAGERQVARHEREEAASARDEGRSDLAARAARGAAGATAIKAAPDSDDSANQPPPAAAPLDSPKTAEDRYFYLKKDEKRNLAMPAGGAPATASPAPIDSPVEQGLDDLKIDTNVRRALASREQVNLIQCDVSQDFIQENQMEKLLKGNKVAFTRLDAPQAAGEKDAVAKIQRRSEQDAGLRYSCQVTPTQVELIVNGLEQDRRRVSNLSLGLQVQRAAQRGVVDNLQELRKRPQVKDTDAADKESDKPRDQQQSVTILLRQADDRKPEEPAKP